VEDTLEIFTDGSCRPNHGPSGIGIRFVYPDEDGDEKTEDLAPTGYQRASIDEMELQAVIVALDEAQNLILPFRLRKILSYTDSLYVVNGIGPAQTSWPRDDWYTSKGTPVENVPLWKKLTKAIERARANGVRVEIHYPPDRHKRHARAAHRRAKISAQSPYNPPLSVSSTGRRLSPIKTARGNVTIRDQMTTIHVISCDARGPQGLWKLRYEVISRGSPDRLKPDFAWSKEVLRNRHCYRVRLGRNPERGYPEIRKIYREVDCPKKPGAKKSK
jgi:ribonuclease HI